MRVSLRRMATLAGLLALATSAIAYDPDATVVISRTQGSPSFTVRYNGAAVALAELRVNGESITTRNLNSSVTSGETNFSVNLSTFVDGENEVEVRLFDKSGKLVGTQRTVVKQDSSEKPAIFLSAPKLGSTVQGPVEIKVGFGQKFKDSYVSFFVDNQFRTMSNVPPFTYVWDSARENNGWHELEAWVVNDGNDTLKSRKVRVFVDNPGGHTTRRFATASRATTPTAPTVPAKAPTDLVTIASTGLTINSNPVKIVPANPAPLAPAAPTFLPLTLLATAVPAKVSLPSRARPLDVQPVAVAATGLRNMTPTGKRVADRPVTAMKPKATVASPASAATHPAAKAVQPTKAAPVVSITKAAPVKVAVAPVKPVVQEIGQPALPGAPVMGSSVNHIRSLSGTEDLRPLAVGTVTMTPAKAAAPASKPVVVKAAVPAAPALKSKPTVKVSKAPGKSPIIKTTKTVTTLLKIVPGVRLPHKGSFAIIMDGDIVEFDVQPRVDSGVPMAPFRHLIEKKGGEVSWENNKKEINATAEGRAIYLQIGTRIARVDKKAVDLELAPYIDRGRTIVPLSFIQETLKVNIDYDKATGHVLITSAK